MKNPSCPRIVIWEFLTEDWGKKILFAFGNGAIFGPKYWQTRALKGGEGEGLF